MRKFHQILMLICTLNLSAYAYQSDTKGFIVLKDGIRETGMVDISNLEDDGIITFKREANRSETYGASDISEFSVNGKELIRSLEIKYAVTNSRDSVVSFFAKRVFEGPIHLEKVYAAPFEYAITKDESTNALQRIQNENRNVIRYFDQYKGVFYLAFRDCEKDIETDLIKFNESAFKEALREYRACVDDDFKFDAKKGNVGLIFGLGINSINLDIEAGSRFFENSDFISNYKTSRKLNYSIGVDHRIYRNYIYVSLISSYQRYDFVHDDRENQRNVGAFTYSEVSLSGSIDFRYPLKYVTPGIGLGYQVTNLISFGGIITGEVQTGTSEFSYRTIRLKEDDSVYQTYGVPFTFLSITKNTTSQIEYGLKLRTVFRDGEYLTRNFDFSEDDLSTEYILSFFMTFRF